MTTMVQEAETGLKRHVVAYLLALREWQGQQGIPAEVTPDPVAGNWQLSGNGGSIRFADGQFTWYEPASKTDGNCYRGTYGVTAGIRTGAGFTAEGDGPDRRCYSVILNHTVDHINGVDHPVDRPGLLFVVELGSPDQVLIYNHRTDSRVLATRVN